MFTNSLSSQDSTVVSTSAMPGVACYAEGTGANAPAVGNPIIDYAGGIAGINNVQQTLYNWYSIFLSGNR
jgi:hypothetical protein